MNASSWEDGSAIIMAEPFRARYIIVVIVGLDVNGATFTISDNILVPSRFLPYLKRIFSHCASRTKKYLSANFWRSSVDSEVL